jgi:iron complex transport system ATP-binding protein
MNISIKNAEYRYGQGFHLRPVNVEIESGTFMVLIGPNGSGKSTLFSLINGVLKPLRGSVEVGSRPVASIPAKERARMMGMVPQVNKISFDYSVEEIVAMGRYPYQGFFSGESGEDRAVIEKVIDRLDLKKFRDRPVQSLSGGEYQRVLLARVLVQQTHILLLDEPGNHLDLKHQTLLLGLLREEVNNGKTVVAVLHDLNQAMLYADKGILLNEGECVGMGKPSEFLNTSLIKDVFEVSLREYHNGEDDTVIFGLNQE